jgi:hypothetical protein
MGAWVYIRSSATRSKKSASLFSHELDPDMQDDPDQVPMNPSALPEKGSLYFGEGGVAVRLQRDMEIGALRAEGDARRALGRSGCFAGDNFTGYEILNFGDTVADG